MFCEPILIGLSSHMHSLQTRVKPLALIVHPHHIEALCCLHKVMPFEDYCKILTGHWF